MRFGNGCWLQKEGCTAFAPKEVYFSNIEERRVVLTAPTTFIRTRGDTLEGINLTLTITSPYPDIIRVQTYHHRGINKKSPDFELNIKENLPLDTKETEDEITITSGGLSLVINKKRFSMSYMRDGKLITKSGDKDLALMKTDWKGFAYDKGDAEETYIRQQLSLGVGEYLYGTGERFTPFIKNGQTIDIWNADGGTSTDQSYKNIPFYISNKGYGVFVNHPEKVSFELGSESVTKAQFSIPGSTLDYFVINGPSMKEVLMRYTDLTGKPSLPAPWTFGLWLSTSFTTNYDEKTVMSFIDGMLDRGINLKVFHFDCFWMKEFHWTDFVWDSRVFPDPAGMLKRIKEKGLKICVWINPYIAQESVLFDEGAEAGYFIKRPDGSIWQWDMWQPGMAIVDFTNPDACKWYQSKLAALMDMGVDCFKTDFGERIPTECTYFDGSDPYKMHNYYTMLYNKTVFELIEEKKGAGEAILFARSATAGGQKFPVHWGGDCWSDYESMEESLRGGLSLTMSGFGFWSHDIGGFENTSTADVYKRWCAFGLLSSHSRLHGSSSYRVPWVYDEEAVDVVRFFTQLKARIMPYLYSMAVKAHTTGIPTMRSMVLEFTNDRSCHYLDKQYMLGDSLLVAPIFNDESMAEYYLPAGRWTNFFTGEVYEGGRYINEKHGYLSIPLMVRPNSVVALGATDLTPEYDYLSGTEFRLYEPADNETASATVYSAGAEKSVTITAIKSDSKLELKLSEAIPCTIRLINTKTADCKGGEAVLDGNDTVITPSSAVIEVTL